MPSSQSTPILLDSSVIAKWFIEEEESDMAVKLRDEFNLGKIQLVITELSYYEVANALRYHKRYDKEDVGLAIAALFRESIPVLPFDQDVLNIAIENAFEYHTSIYDAYLVAQADLNDICLITSDKKLANKVRPHSYVMTLAEWAKT